MSLEDGGTQSSIRDVIPGRIERVIKFFSLQSSLLASACTGLIMTTLVLDVANRAYTGGSIPGAFELVSTLVVLVVFFGLANAERTGTHVRVQLVTSRMSQQSAGKLRLIGYTGTIVILSALVYATGSRAVDSVATQEFRHGVIFFPVWPARVVVAFGFLLTLLEVGLKIRHIIVRLMERTSNFR